MNNCDKFLGSISNYIDGDLQKAEQAFMEEHELQCLPCQKKALQIRQLTRRLPRLPRVKTTPSFDLTLHARLRAEINRKRSFSLFPNLGIVWQIPAYAAAAILFIGLGIFLDRLLVRQNFVSPTSIVPVVVEESLPKTSSHPNPDNPPSPQTKLSHYVGLKQINPKELLRREGTALSFEEKRRTLSSVKDSVESGRYKSRESVLNLRQANVSIPF